MTWWGTRPPPADEAWQDYEATYAWFLGLQLLDLLSTLAVLGVGGGESNPLAQSQWEEAGAAGLVGWKVLVILLTFAAWLPAFGWLAARPAPTRRWALPMFYTGLLACVVVYTFVVFYNLRNLSILLGAQG